MIDIKPGDLVSWRSRGDKINYGIILIVSDDWSRINKVVCRMYKNKTEIMEWIQRKYNNNKRQIKKTNTERIFAIAVDNHSIPKAFPIDWIIDGRLKPVKFSDRIWSAEELGMALNRYLDHPWKFGAKEEFEYNITKILQNFGDVLLEIHELNEAGNTLLGGMPRSERIVKHTEDFVLAKKEAWRVYEAFRAEIKAYQNPEMKHWIIFRRYFEECKTIFEISGELKRDRATVKKYISDIIENIRLSLELQDIDADLVFWFCELLHVKGMKKRKKVS